MTFRGRLLTTVTLVVVTPLAALAVLIPREMTRRFTTEYRARAATLATAIRTRLMDEGARIDAQLAAIGEELRNDNDVRAAIVYQGGNPRAVVTFAREAMSAAGLTVLQIQDDSGRILSSGHFQNEFGRVDRELPDALRRARAENALVSLRTAEGPILAHVRMLTVALGPRPYTVIGGAVVDEQYLARLVYAPEMLVGIALPAGATDPTIARGDATAGESGIADSIPMLYIDAARDSVALATAHFTIEHSRARLDAVVRDVRIWLIGSIVVAMALALAVALWLAARLSRPLVELASETENVDLERLDARFSAASRDDEVGTLARGLSAMLGRLRASTTRLREAERRATIGEVARQINHDIKNGLAPIRNVVRHLAQVARDAPHELAPVFAERQKTLESSIEYLDSLSRNYARLSPRLDVAPCEVAPVIEEVVRNARTRTSAVRSVVAPGLAPVIADAAVLRRILENLVGNAIDALDQPTGATPRERPREVVVSAESAGADRPVGMVRITVADTGRGMTERELAKAFDDFYTTKPGGTGLGLSVVRRLVADLSGALRVDTAPGSGTRVTVDIPAARSAESPGAPAGEGSAGGALRGSSPGASSRQTPPSISGGTR